MTAILSASEEAELRIWHEAGNEPYYKDVARLLATLDDVRARSDRMFNEAAAGLRTEAAMENLLGKAAVVLALTDGPEADAVWHEIVDWFTARRSEDP